MLSRSISAAQRSGLVSSIDRIKSTSVQYSYAHSIRGAVTPLSGGWGRRVRFSTSRLGHERTKEQLENVTEELLRGKGDVVSTFHFQQSLPRLKIPDLEKTCEKYLRASQPLVSKQQHDKTRAIVDHFRGVEPAADAADPSFGVGLKLHEQLKARDAANKDTSYISEPWFNMYLADRRPLPLNNNPAMIFNPHPGVTSTTTNANAVMQKLATNPVEVPAGESNPNWTPRARRAAGLVASSLKFYRTLKADRLEPDMFHMNAKKTDTSIWRRMISLIPKKVSWYAAVVFKVFPLDMIQYTKLFGTTRLPRKDKDDLLTAEDPRHIMILSKDKFYKLDVRSEDGRWITPSELLAALTGLEKAEAGTGDVNALPIGLLTSMERNQWSDARKEIEANDDDKKSLSEIDSALFMLSLDDTAPTKDEELAALMLHGPQGRNRWFDKSFSMIVDRGGQAALTFEHAWGDGIPVLRFFVEIFNDSLKAPLDLSESVSDAPAPAPVASFEARPLAWSASLKDRIGSAVEGAQSEMDAAVARLNLARGFSTSVTKPILKRHGLSPDAVVQLSFQLAFNRMSGGKFSPHTGSEGGDAVSTYESASTGAFLHGRTEVIRSATPESVDFVRAMNESGEGTEHRMKQREALSCAVKAHSALSKAASMGGGVDRHLFALRDLDSRSDSPLLPAIFDDPTYTTYGANILSTSTLASPALQGGAFGPVHDHGYGIGYALMDNYAGFLVSSYQDSKALASAIESSLDDIVTLLEETAEKKE
eukprot:TRINITY_DN12999_c0_g1_i1.p1 TRINITY_DN12999_c0_g1~~TRINITY_DN12999_c0_g1_i1.p1  ORF type:complete len:763 (-),score=134.46 TRINITY_DN12999_c0_g1_i1:176-2464(-)